MSVGPIHRHYTRDGVFYAELTKRAGGWWWALSYSAPNEKEFREIDIFSSAEEISRQISSGQMNKALGFDARGVQLPADFGRWKMFV